MGRHGSDTTPYACGASKEHIDSRKADHTMAKKTAARKKASKPASKATGKPAARAIGKPASKQPNINSGSKRASKPASKSSSKSAKKPGTKTSKSLSAPREFSPKVTELPILVIDAFTRRQFHGNAAAVVLCDDKFLSDDLMQLIAAENNVSETAFIVVKSFDAKLAKVDIRWFSPIMEIDLCGHATLAAAHALLHEGQLPCDTVNFRSPISGLLPVHRMEHLYVLDFPAVTATPMRNDDKLAREISAALGRQPAELFLGRDIMAVFDNKRDVHELAPDFAKLAALSHIKHLGLVATAPAVGHDFVSRCFYPRAGVNEDAVTGSAHCMLTPYWAARLGKVHLSAHQVSHRSGELFCEFKPGQGNKDDRVLIGGHAVTVSFGQLMIETP